MADLLFHLKPVQGYNNVFEPGERGMKLTRFGVLQLSAGTSYAASTGDFEVALVLLGGKCSIKGKDFNFAEVGQRKNVFDGKPHTVYLPRRTDYTVTVGSSQYTLDQHIKHGIHAEELIRIYFCWDDESRKILIGSMPGHLATVRNST